MREGRISHGHHWCSGESGSGEGSCQYRVMITFDGWKYHQHAAKEAQFILIYVVRFLVVIVY